MSVENQINEELCDMSKDMPLATYIRIHLVKWADYVIRIENYHIANKVLEEVSEEKYQQKDHVAGGRVTYRRM